MVEPLEDLGLNTSDINSVLLACCCIVPTPPGLPEDVSTTRSAASDASVSSEESVVYEDVIKAFHLSGSISRSLQLKRDWVRFVTCCRLCIAHLGSNR